MLRQLARAFSLLLLLLLAGCASRQPTVLHKAISAGDPSSIDAALAQDVDVNARDPYRNTALHLACRKDQVNLVVIEQLIERGAEVNVTNKAGKTPLDLALDQRGNGALIRLLGKHGAELNQTDPYGNTLLLLSVMNEQTDNAQALIEAGADINRVGYMGYTPLLAACEEKSMEEPALLLIERGAEVQVTNNSGFTPLMRACELSTPKVVDALLAAGARVNAKSKDNWTPLLITCNTRSEPEILRSLLDAGARIDVEYAHGLHPLLLAAGKSNSVEMVRLLLDAGAEVNRMDDVVTGKGRHPGNTALQAAAQLSETPEILQLLIDAGADVDKLGSSNGWAALHFAARYGKRAESVRILLDAGANPMLETGNGFLPFFVALEHMKVLQAKLPNSGTLRKGYEREWAELLTTLRLLGQRTPLEVRKEQVDRFLNKYKRGSSPTVDAMLEAMLKVQIEMITE